VNQKQKELDQLQPSADTKQKLDRWIETEFVYSTLKLEGVDVPRDQVSLITSSHTAPYNSPEIESAGALLESLRTLTSIARSKGKDAALSVELLLKLNRLAAGTRHEDEAVTDAMANKARLILESACQWFIADSFAELHPVEQASIVFLRLIEIKPFDRRDERTALLGASLFTLRSGLPPIIIEPDRQPSYRAALNEGLGVNTKPMVEFIAASIERSLGEMIARFKG
jgi:hypothetical protein